MWKTDFGMTQRHLLGSWGFPGGSGVNNMSAMQDNGTHRFNPWVRKIPWSREWKPTPLFFFFFSFIFIRWRLITLQYCSGFCHTLTWISHGFTCVPYPEPPSHLPLHPIPLGHPSAPALSTCLMHPAWAGDLFHTCFDAILSDHPTLAFSNRVQKSVLYICVSFSVLHIGLSLPSF